MEDRIIVDVARGTVTALLPRDSRELTMRKLYEAKREMDDAEVPFNNRTVILNLNALESLFIMTPVEPFDNFFPVRQLYYGDSTSFLSFEFKCEDWFADPKLLDN